MGAIATQNLTAMEQVCTNCTLTQAFGFYKIMWKRTAPAEYVCRATATITSKYGIIVDRACTPMDCLGIETRPFSKAVSSPLSCTSYPNVENPTSEVGTVTYVRDVMEIVLIFVFLFGLVLRGEWLKGLEALQRKRRLRQQIIGKLYHQKSNDHPSNEQEPSEEEGYDEVDLNESKPQKL